MGKQYFDRLELDDKGNIFAVDDQDETLTPIEISTIQWSVVEGCKCEVVLTQFKPKCDCWYSRKVFGKKDAESYANEIYQKHEEAGLRKKGLMKLIWCFRSGLS
ncbi:hypothetical protein [Aeromonas veronii]|uniref:hypothetical protein n=1 Tax=Aeromonas veronii TaxID=654 RepID=UPI00191D4316|nr:hypothetical protein [Aeromonas veronii]MBL0489577.1 hypothetical protein [Aeromonas veronii]